MHHSTVARAFSRALVTFVVVCLSMTLTPNAVAAPADKPGASKHSKSSHAKKVKKAKKAKLVKTKKAKRVKKIKLAKSKRVKLKAALPVKALKVARNQKGDPYRYGASGPSAFDCSGLTSYSYKRAGKSLPRSSGAQRSATKRISRSKARKGDLVFFHGRGGVYHVGLYEGGNKILHAPYSGTRVRTEKIWTSNVSFGRVA